jgi:hypothetical protein
MKTLFLTLLFIALASACETVADDSGPDNRLVPPQGVIQGTVVYQGPHPCSADGHILGNAILLFFDKDNPPPPEGVASTAVNLGVVVGDNLFANEPRFNGEATYCPKDHGETGTITASAPFSVSPFAAGTYIVEAFFDYTGDFLPTFKFRELPEQGDVAGGYIDTTAALMHVGDANYEPTFLPIVVGVSPTQAQEPSEAGEISDAGGDGSPDSLVIPASGYVANNITVTLGDVLPLARPYFYPSGGNVPASMGVTTPTNPNGNVNYVPFGGASYEGMPTIATMSQDIHVLASPGFPTESEATAFQASFLSITLEAGVAADELADAVDPMDPFHFQLSASNPKSLFIWSSGTTIPESTLVDSLYPQVVLTKLVDDPMHTLDPQSITQQTPTSAAPGPVVVLLGITLGSSDTIYGTALMPPPTSPGPTTAADHVTALVRPTAICLDPTNPCAGSTLVTPFLTGTVAGGATTGPLFDPTTVKAALAPVFGNVTIVQGCLPTGRYAINLVFPTGQAWTVPNESGSCAASEGTIVTSSSPPTCSMVPAQAAARPVLYSQGTRGIVEIVPGSTCSSNPVPAACLPSGSSP